MTTARIFYSRRESPYQMANKSEKRKLHEEYVSTLPYYLSVQDSHQSIRRYLTNRIKNSSSHLLFGVRLECLYHSDVVWEDIIAGLEHEFNIEKKKLTLLKSNVFIVADIWSDGSIRPVGHCYILLDKGSLEEDRYSRDCVTNLHISYPPTAMLLTQLEYGETLVLKEAYSKNLLAVPTEFKRSYIKNNKRVGSKKLSSLNNEPSMISDPPQDNKSASDLPIKTDYSKENSVNCGAKAKDIRCIFIPLGRDQPDGDVIIQYECRKSGQVSCKLEHFTRKEANRCYALYSKRVSGDRKSRKTQWDTNKSNQKSAPMKNNKPVSNTAGLPFDSVAFEAQLLSKLELHDKKATLVSEMLPRLQELGDTVIKVENIPSNTTIDMFNRELGLCNIEPSQVIGSKKSSSNGYMNLRVITNSCQPEKDRLLKTNGMKCFNTCVLKAEKTNWKELENFLLKNHESICKFD